MIKPYSTSLWLNGLFLLTMIALVVYTKATGLSAKALFLHPEIYSHVTIASLTHLFQFLCTIPPIVCLFTYNLLRINQLQTPAFRHFLLASAGVTGGFWLNEIYRIHIYLSRLGIGKPIVILFYAIILAAYVIGYRQQLRSTPYPLLFIGVGILFVGIGIDALHLNQNTTDFLEGVPKVLSQVNVTFYFWSVCQQAIQPAIASSKNFLPK